MEVSYLLIRKAFEIRTALWAAGLPSPIPVAYENAPFVIPADGRYVSCFILPGSIDSADLAGKHREYVGVFQITLNLPLSVGSRESAMLADSLDLAFPISAPMVQDGAKIWVVSPMSPSNPLDSPNANALVVPVSARYKAEKFL